MFRGGYVAPRERTVGDGDGKGVPTRGGGHEKDGEGGWGAESESVLGACVDE